MEIVAYNSIKNLFYRENTIIHNQLFTESYKQLKTIFDSSEDLVLTLCADNDLHDLIKNGTACDYERIKRKCDDYKNINSTTNSIYIYPIVDDLVYTHDSNSARWIVKDDINNIDNQSYRFNWTFTPNNTDVIRISRFIYDLNDISKIIGIVEVDVSLPAIVPIIYSFGASSGYDSNLYLINAENSYLLPYHYSGTFSYEDYTQLSEESLTSFNMNKDYYVEKEFLNNGWKMISVINYKSLIKGFNEFSSIIILTCAALALLAIILSYLFTRKITKPILVLSDKVSHNAKNEKFIELDVPKGISKECSTLYGSYNYLIREVNKSIKNIQEFSEKEKENQFLLLQAQINPHFLYNTLNAISWMARNNQNDDIEKMVVCLVTMFRNSLNNGKPFISLNLELEHVNAYLEIMQYRYPNRYNVVFDIDESTRDLMITKQILQPLAENALTHGFLEADIEGTITIRSYVEHDYLYIVMENTGSEIDLKLVNDILSGDPRYISKHYGIRNVNNRLLTYYGKECGLNYTYEDGVTGVIIKLPLDKIKENMHD